MEKCYRDIQHRGQIAGLNLLEIFVLLGVPLLLAPLFTLLNINFGIILLIEFFLYILFRLAAKVSPFDFGLASFIFSRFIWPRRLSGYILDEQKYMKTKAKSAAPNKQNVN